MYDGQTFRGVDATAAKRDRPADTVLAHYLVNGLRFNEREFDRAGGGLLLDARNPLESDGPKSG